MVKIFVLIILLCSPFITFGQNEPEFNTSRDSIRISHKEITPPVEIKPNFIIPLRSLNSFPLSLKLGQYSFTPISENNNELNTDLLYPSLSLNEKFKISFLYNILGAIQVGAVGYLAYRHVKKFGLFK